MSQIQELRKHLEDMEKGLALWNDEIRKRLQRIEDDVTTIKKSLPGEQPPIDPRHVAERLGLRPAEGRVAAALAEGNTTRDIAEATGCTVGTVRYQFKQIYRKLNISTQAQLVRVVLLLPHSRATNCKADAESPGHCDR